MTLSYQSIGSGPALVLLHPVGLDRTFWGSLIPQAATRNRVIAVDLRGHGASTAADPKTQIEAYAADVLELLDGLNVARTTLLGLSFGGMIAQEVALAAPQQVARLLVGACGPGIAEGHRESVRARGTTALQGGMQAVVEATLARWFTADFLTSPEVDRVRDRLMRDQPAHWAAAWQAIADFDATGRLPQLRLPALVMAGELDAGTSLAVAKKLAASISGSEFVQLNEAPHMMQIECAERFATVVLEFLERTAGHA